MSSDKLKKERNEYRINAMFDMGHMNLFHYLTMGQMDVLTFYAKTAQLVDMKRRHKDD